MTIHILRHLQLNVKNGSLSRRSNHGSNVLGTSHESFPSQITTPLTKIQDRDFPPAPRAPRGATIRLL